MTAIEAIDIIKTAIAEVEWNYPLDYAIAFETAVEALKKQIPQKPKLLSSGEFYSCPNCDIVIRKNEPSHGNIDIPHCKWCGQALDWGNGERSTDK